MDAQIHKTAAQACDRLTELTGVRHSSNSDYAGPEPEFPVKIFNVLHTVDGVEQGQWVDLALFNTREERLAYLQGALYIAELKIVVTAKVVF
jgi:hypothetical protein